MCAEEVADKRLGTQSDGGRIRLVVPLGLRPARPRRARLGGVVRFGDTPLGSGTYCMELLDAGCELHGGSGLSVGAVDVEPVEVGLVGEPLRERPVVTRGQRREGHQALRVTNALGLRDRVESGVCALHLCRREAVRLRLGLLKPRQVWVGAGCLGLRGDRLEGVEVGL